MAMFVFVVTCSVFTWCMNGMFITPNVMSHMRQHVVDLSFNKIIDELPRIKGMVNIKQFKTQQIYQDIPIYGATLVISEDTSDADNDINVQSQTPIFGRYYPIRSIVEFMANNRDKTTLAEEDVLKILMSALDIQSIDDIIDHNDIDYKLWIYHIDNVPFLVYIVRFAYINHSDLDNYYEPMIVIDAFTGDILDIFNQAHNILGCGDGGNAKTGKYSYCHDRAPLHIPNSEDPPKLKVTDKFQIWDNQNKIRHDHSAATESECIPRINDSTYCDINDRDGEIINTAYCTTCDAFAFMQLTFDMYLDWMNISKPIPDDDLPIETYIHVGIDWVNAVYSYGGKIQFGDGRTGFYPLITTSITSHEIAHGFTNRGSDLTYAKQSGGMNEAYSDLAGQTAKAYLRSNIDWTIGSEVVASPNDAFRYLCDPPKDHRSIDHFDDYYDEIDVHWSSGLYNKASCWLDIVYGWSIKKIFVLFSTTNLYYWTADSTFNEGLCGLDQALQRLYATDQDLERFRCELAASFEIVGIECISSILNCNSIDRFECVGTGSNANYCLYTDIKPSNIAPTSFQQKIRMIENKNNKNNTEFEINFRNIGSYNCINPYIRFEYEQIDYSINVLDNKFIQIIDPQVNSAPIATCVGNDDTNPQCFQYDFCINDYSLSSDILIDNDHIISVILSGDVNGLCISRWVINATLTLYCDPDCSIYSCPNNRNDECCGDLLCNNGECDICVNEGHECSNNNECCDDTVCLLNGICGCQYPSNECGMNDECCNDMICNDVSECCIPEFNDHDLECKCDNDCCDGGNSLFCNSNSKCENCREYGGECNKNCDCCGHNDGQVVCRQDIIKDSYNPITGLICQDCLEINDKCINTNDCCADMVCNSDTNECQNCGRPGNSGKNQEVECSNNDDCCADLICDVKKRKCKELYSSSSSSSSFNHQFVIYIGKDSSSSSSSSSSASSSSYNSYDHYDAYKAQGNENLNLEQDSNIKENTKIDYLKWSFLVIISIIVLNISIYVYCFVMKKQECEEIKDIDYL